MPKDPAQRVVDAVVKRLQEEREKQGMSKNKLANLAGIDPKTVAFIEKRERNPTLYTLVKIASGLGIRLGAILEEEL